MAAPTLGLAEAAKATGVSESTLRRRRSELTALGASRTDKGWRIPVTALIELGLMDRQTGPLVKAPESPADARVKAFMEAPTDNHLIAQMEALREKLADAEKRAAVAEAVAAERERIIKAQEMALRMLEAPKPSQVSPKPAAAEAEAPSEQAPQPARRRWWRR